MKIYFIRSKQYMIDEFYHPEQKKWIDIEDGPPFDLNSMYCCIQLMSHPASIEKKDKQPAPKGKGMAEVKGNKNLYIIKITYIYFQCSATCPSLFI